MDFVEGVGESSSPPRSFGGFSGYEIVNDVYNRLLEIGNDEATTQPEFRDQLAAHFIRLPASYALDINLNRVEDVLLHQKLLILAKDPENRPVFHVRFLENYGTQVDGDEDQQEVSVGPELSHDKKPEMDVEACSKLEDLNLEVRSTSLDKGKENLDVDSFKRQDDIHVPIHEVIFSAVDKPKLLSQLSALVSDIGLNIREAHVFSTTDGYSLDVFVVDGWPLQETKTLHEAMERAIARSEGSWCGSKRSKSAIERASFVDTEIDLKLLNIGEKVASGSCGDLHRGVYIGQEVAVKIFRSEQLNEALENEFAHEVTILREVCHKNVVRFIGACTKQPNMCIITEYMPGGSLFEYLHKNHHNLSLPQLVQFAIDVCEGMEYLHHNNIIHRDLKTANLLMDSNNVVKVADFGVARFQNQQGVMTAETGTYRWMAPEVINHQPYDQKADVFSFAIVLWELVTAKIPYRNMTPLQAALGVRLGKRPDLPTNTHPKLLELMQRCWETEPDIRPSFSEIKLELVTFLHQLQVRRFSHDELAVEADMASTLELQAMSTSRGSAMSSQYRSTDTSSKSGVCKGWKAPFRRCYCGEGAPCSVSWSDKNLERRYYGCNYWPDEKEDCGYFDSYDDGLSELYKQVLNEMKPKKKPGIPEFVNPRLIFLVKVMIGLLLVLVLVVAIVGVLIVCKG
ncbi:hypothetical protein LXL04_029984 [Taraxacum kok-saghyz]